MKKTKTSARPTNGTLQGRRIFLDLANGMHLDLCKLAKAHGLTSVNQVCVFILGWALSQDTITPDSEPDWSERADF